MSVQRPKLLSKLKGSRVLILCGSSGAGFRVAEALIEQDASVIISSSSSERVQKAVQRLKIEHPAAIVQGYTCNLGSVNTLESEVDDLFGKIANTGGKLNHVVFTAGDALAIRKLEDYTLPQVQQAGLVRFYALIVVAQRCRKHMVESLSSSLTLTTGGIPKHLMKDWRVVQGYIAGVTGLARGLAMDLAPIRVNAIGLGFVETELWNSAKGAGVYEKIAADIETKMTTKAADKVEGVVETYLYVMKDGNVAGSIVNIHGGTLLL
jgi:NAD(P)-dependent dehydrogenase (short-subunit alcohol dehydrogenase family)